MLRFDKVYTYIQILKLKNILVKLLSFNKNLLFCSMNNKINLEILHRIITPNFWRDEAQSTFADDYENFIKRKSQEEFEATLDKIADNDEESISSILIGKYLKINIDHHVETYSGSWLSFHFIVIIPIVMII